MTRALRSCPAGLDPASAHPSRSARARGAAAMGDGPPHDAFPRQQGTQTLVKARIQIERPRLHKVILLNDDYTPREFVILVLKSEFRMSEDQAFRVMMTAHRRGACVVAVFTRDVAETKATRATDMAKAQGFPLMFTTEPEE